MIVNYEFACPSTFFQQEDQYILGLSPDLSRDEKVSFVGSLKHPLIFRDAMLMVREIVISDMRMKKKDYTDFFIWYNQEIERRMLDKEKILKKLRGELQGEMTGLKKELTDVEQQIQNIQGALRSKKHIIDGFGMWGEYNKIESHFWQFIKHRDHELWWVLDPVITVHPDQVSFEAFSLDESIYGCLSVKMEEFEIKGKPKLGTTNIDFSTKLAKELERFRTYNDVELSINPEGFVVETGVKPEHMEKKIDLPDTWVKGFNQVSAAASLTGYELEISPVDMYDICSFLRRHKAHKSPRSMRWISKPGKPIKIIFEPWNKELELSTSYSGNKESTMRIWGRRRWLILEKIIPIAKSFKIRFLGFGMPLFIIADLGTMHLTIGLTSWSSNDWVRGTAFNIMAGLMGDYDPGVYELLKNQRIMNIQQIKDQLKATDQDIKSGLGLLLRRGEGYYDPIIQSYRFRKLFNIPLPEKFYELTQLEKAVLAELDSTMETLMVELDASGEFMASNYHQKSFRRKTAQRAFYSRPSYESVSKRIDTIIKYDEDQQITKVKCGCREFQSGARNISAPCRHLLALYIVSSEFLDLPLNKGRPYFIKKLKELKKYD